MFGLYKHNFVSNLSYIFLFISILLSNIPSSFAEPPSLDILCQEAGGVWNECGSDCDPCIGQDSQAFSPLVCTAGCTPRCECPDGLAFDGLYCVNPTEVYLQCDQGFIAELCNEAGGTMECVACDTECLGDDHQVYVTIQDCEADCQPYCTCSEGQIFTPRGCEDTEEVSLRMCLPHEEVLTQEEYVECTTAGGAWDTCASCNTECLVTSTMSTMINEILENCICTPGCVCPEGQEFFYDSCEETSTYCIDITAEAQCISSGGMFSECGGNRCGRYYCVDDQGQAQIKVDESIECPMTLECVPNCICPLDLIESNGECVDRGSIADGLKSCSLANDSPEATNSNTEVDTSNDSEREVATDDGGCEQIQDITPSIWIVTLLLCIAILNNRYLEYVRKC